MKDKNGYAPTIVGTGDECFICLKSGELVRHEIYHGPFREKSKRLGLWVTLCPACHWKVHNSDGRDDMFLKRVGQFDAQAHYGWSTADFRREFGKNYSIEEKY